MDQENEHTKTNLDKEHASEAEIEGVECIDRNKKTVKESKSKQKVLDRKIRRRQPVIEMICAQKPRMESLVTLAAEWFSLEEMMVLQGVSALISTNVKE